MRGRARVGVALALIAAAPGEARALDAFEIQVYDGTANPPGVFGLELHTNAVASGVATSTPPELAPNHQAHFTLEPSFGLTNWWELGAYFQTALRPDAGFDYAGIKLRSKFVTPPAWSARGRLGINFEVGDLPARYEADRWGLEVRPILSWSLARLRFAANPIIDVPLTGGAATFEPDAQALWEMPRVASFGLEYYAALGPLSGFSSARDQEHYLFEVANLLAVRNLELEAGVGEGLTAASNALVLKVIVGYTFDRAR